MYVSIYIYIYIYHFFSRNDSNQSHAALHESLFLMGQIIHILLSIRNVNAVETLQFRHPWDRRTLVIQLSNPDTLGTEEMNLVIREIYQKLDSVTVLEI